MLKSILDLRKGFRFHTDREKPIHYNDNVMHMHMVL